MISSKVPYLDGWRGVAIVAVLLSHFVGGPAFAWLGQFGVQLFFVLSGYFMSNLLFMRRVDLATFFVRRFSRVVPTFWLFVAAMYCYARWLQPEPFSPSGGEVLATLTFARTYLPHDLNIFSEVWPISHVWSLNVEEHSYVFLALGALLLRATQRHAWAPAFLCASVIASLAFTLYYSTHPPAGASPWTLYSQCAAYGLLASAAYRITRDRFKIPLLERWAGAVGLLALVVASAFSIPGTPFNKVTIAGLAMAVAVNHIHELPSGMRQALSWPALRWFGACSFSLYLWQQPFFLLHRHGVNAALCAAGAVAIGALSFYAFENPLRVRINRAWAQRRGPTPLAQETRPAA